MSKKKPTKPEPVDQGLAVRQALVNMIFDLAQEVSRRALTGEQVDQLRSSLDGARRRLDGELTDYRFAELAAPLMADLWGTVSTEDGPLRDSQFEFVREFLESMSDADQLALVRSTLWADVVDSSAPQLVAPALSEPLNDDQADAGVDGPPTDDEPAQSNSDATDVVDAEIIEDVEAVGPIQVGQTTSSQRRYNVGAGGYGPPAVTNPALARSITGGRRQPQIQIGGEAAGWS